MRRPGRRAHPVAAHCGSAPPTLRTLRDEGVVGTIGVGTTDVGCATTLVVDQMIEVVMLATRWTLVNRSGAAQLPAELWNELEPTLSAAC